MAPAVAESTPPLSRSTAGWSAILSLRRRFGAFRRIVFFVPAANAFVEHFHVAVAVFIENAIGQTGQVVRARSIEHDRSIAWDALEIFLELSERRRDRAENM